MVSINIHGILVLHHIPPTQPNFILVTMYMYAMNKDNMIVDDMHVQNTCDGQL